MPEAGIGVEQLVDEMLETILLTNLNSTTRHKPWKVSADFGGLP